MSGLGSAAPGQDAVVCKGLFTNDVSIFWGLRHPLVLMSAYHKLLACPLVLQIDDVICEQPRTKMIIFRIQFVSIRVNRICVTYAKSTIHLAPKSLFPPSALSPGQAPSRQPCFADEEPGPPH